MINEDELYLFKKELYRLYEDYEKCQEETVKQEIYRDILLLNSAICEGSCNSNTDN